MEKQDFMAADAQTRLAYLKECGYDDVDLPLVPDEELDEDTINCDQAIVHVYEGGYSKSDLESFLEEIDEKEELIYEWSEFDKKCAELFDDLEEVTE